MYYAISVLHLRNYNCDIRTGLNSMIYDRILVTMRISPPTTDNIARKVPLNSVHENREGMFQKRYYESSIKLLA